LTLDSAGARLNPNTELRYMPYGAARYTAGTTPTSDVSIMHLNR
jgi:hypothetical protein